MLSTPCIQALTVSLAAGPGQEALFHRAQPREAVDAHFHGHWLRLGSGKVL